MTYRERKCSGDQGNLHSSTIKKCNARKCESRFRRKPQPWVYLDSTKRITRSRKNELPNTVLYDESDYDVQENRSSYKLTEAQQDQLKADGELHVLRVRNISFGIDRLPLQAKTNDLGLCMYQDLRRHCESLPCDTDGSAKIRHKKVMLRNALTH